MKKKEQRKKRAVTLIEMIVVMLLIATITGALAYNYNASLKEGKAFKTREGISRIKTILELAILDDSSKVPENVESWWANTVKSSPLASGDLTKDGWGKPYKVHYKPDTQEFVVESDDLNNYKK